MGVIFGNPAASAKEAGFEVDFSEVVDTPPSHAESKAQAAQTNHLEIEAFQRANKRLADAYKEEFDTAEDAVEKTQMFFKTNTLTAAKVIFEICQNSNNDRTRLSAAQYIVDRGLGPVAKSETPESELEKLVKGMQARKQNEDDARNPAKQIDPEPPEDSDISDEPAPVAGFENWQPGEEDDEATD